MQLREYVNNNVCVHVCLLALNQQAYTVVRLIQKKSVGVHVRCCVHCPPLKLKHVTLSALGGVYGEYHPLQSPSSI